jgi:simple sugar transport system ATP-binding protein
MAPSDDPLAGDPPATPVVEMTGITITFPGVRALDQVDFRLFPGEVHALMGENGAGKSTLIKALTGIYQYDVGQVSVMGRDVRFSGVEQSQAAGISTVFQEVNLAANLTVAENVTLGHEPKIGPFLNWPKMRRIARTHLERLHLDIDPGSLLGGHVIGVQQLCAIARATSVDAKVLILDEPTSSLDQVETEELFQVIRELKARGVAILFVSHFLDQVYEIADRITVLRNGALVGEYLVEDLPKMDLISKMIGKSLEELEAVSGAGAGAGGADRSGEPLVQCLGLGKAGSIRPFDLDLYPAEVVGLIGLLGSGRTELVRLLYGADVADKGSMAVEGRKQRRLTPLGALRQGIAFSTEDRKREGIVGDLTVRENIALAIQANRGMIRRIDESELDGIVDQYMEALDIQPRNPDMPIKNMSGGNQQKVLLARWLATQPKLLILDEPTRGIDVGTKAEIQRLVTDLAAQGMSVVFVSSEFEEVLRVSHRLAVLRDRVKIAELDNGPDVTEAKVLDIIASAPRGSEPA